MYHFAVVALLAIGTIKLVDFLADLIPMRELPAIRSVLTFAAAVGAVWILDYSVFEGWAIDVRNHAVGVWMTAFLVAGATVPWRAGFRWLTHDSSTIDESLGEHVKLRKVA
ncbi:MAG TPA: hypothetical protein VGQ20_09315 [Acidimicrobiales bacterium]|jgi:hypothetical protein|nr:hypothetical protein [Acidimicrobiales bacterium]